MSYPGPAQLREAARFAAGQPADLPCELRLTGVKGSNGRRLNVRCQCMAGTQGVPKARFSGYDPLGEAGSIEQALAMWRQHAAGRRS